MTHDGEHTLPEQYISPNRSMSLWYPRNEAIIKLYNIQESRGLDFAQIVQYCFQSLNALSKVDERWGLKVPYVIIPDVDPNSQMFVDVVDYIARIPSNTTPNVQARIGKQLATSQDVVLQILQEISTPEDLEARLNEIADKIDSRDTQLTQPEIVLLVLSGQKNRILNQREIGILFGLKHNAVNRIILDEEKRRRVLDDDAHVENQLPINYLTNLVDVLLEYYPNLAHQIQMVANSENPLIALQEIFEAYEIPDTMEDRDNMLARLSLARAFLQEGYVTDALVSEFRSKLEVLAARNYSIETPDFADMSLLEQSRLNTLVDSAFPGTSLEANIGFFAANVVAVARRNDGIPYGVGVLGLHDFYSARNGNPLSDLAVFCFNTAVVDQNLWGVGTGRALISARFDALVNGSFFEKIRNMYSTNTDRLQALKEGMWIAYADFSDVGMLRAFLEEGAHRGLIPTSLTKGVLGEAGLIDDLRDEKVNGVKCSHFTFKYGDRGTLDINGQKVPVHKRLIHRYILLNGNEGTYNLLHTIRQDFANYQWSGKWEDKKDGRFWRFDEQQAINCEQDYLLVMAGGDLEPIVFENTIDPILFPEEWRREQARQVALFNEAVIANAGKETPVLLQAPEPVAYRVAIGPKIEE